MTMFERIENLRKSAGLSQGKLEKELGFSNGSISKWKNSTPTPDRLQKLADYFHVSLEYLMNGKERAVDYLVRTDEGNEILVEPYYLNDDAREMAQFLFEHPEYKVLFDASRKVSGADIETVKAILDKFRSDDM